MTSTKSKPSKLATAIKAAENVRGVSVNKPTVNTKPFRVKLTKDKVLYDLGYYESVTEAAKAYNKKAKALFGSEKAAKAKGRWNQI